MEAVAYWIEDRESIEQRSVWMQIQSSFKTTTKTTTEEVMK